MKIAIKANPSRGKEIISLLENLGGVKSALEGNGEFYTYYIDECNVIRYHDAPTNYKVYTLEEFEQEFPFKVGDIVTLNGINKPHKIVALEFYVSKLYYKLDNGFHFSPRALTIYGKMKEERNITLTLDKAKEWYNKGGELRKIALQAFTEKELTEVDLPKTWKEFCNDYSTKNGECYIGVCSEMRILPEFDEGRDVEMDKNVCPSQKSAEAHLAMIQLEQLRDCWRQGWKPTKYDTGYCITQYPEEYLIMTFNFISFLSFPTKEIAKKFLECFRDLIEKAGDLIN